MDQRNKSTALLFVALGIGSASASTLGVDWDGTVAAMHGLGKLAKGHVPDAVNVQMIAMGTLATSVVLGVIRRIVMTILMTGAIAGVAFTLLNLRH